MGKIIQIRCDNCDYGAELHTGQGMRDNDPDVVSCYFPDSKREIIHSTMTAGKVWNYRKAPVLCRKCGRCTTVPLFVSPGDDGVRIAGVCGCGHDIRNVVLIQPDEGILNVPCPKCGGRLSSAVTGFWD